ncbi:hypothetical protein [Streptomyces flaveolus]|uniref:hypothetical protein n=1 Tax=Streptomyces flaveolus TaxID=67297 RepID=UPI0033E6EF41
MPRVSSPGARPADTGLPRDWFDLLDLSEGPYKRPAPPGWSTARRPPRGAERTVFVPSMEQIGTGRYREDEGAAFLPPAVRLSSEDFAGAHAGAVFGNSVGPLPLPVR